MRFDWYQATVKEHPIVLVESLLASLAPGGQVKEGKGRHNYYQSFSIHQADGDRAALVLAGGPNGDPNVTASGAATDGFVGLVRANWPAHRVTRFDAAEDFAQEGAYEALERVCRAVAKEKRVKGRSIVPDDLADGRTYYLGAASSDVRTRLYDKGAELRGKLPPEMHSLVPQHLARLEVQVRPRKEWKSYAATLQPEQAWGFAEWTSVLAREAFKLDIDRITMQAGKETDFARTHRFFLRQYGNHLRQLFIDSGSWDLVGRNIGEDLANLDALTDAS